MGAWIETKSEIREYKKTIVAPFMGAWIETKSRCEIIDELKSLPSWERGLKL